MPTEILQKSGTAVVFADVTDYSSTISGLARTDQIDLTSLAAGAARESDKADFGSVRAHLFAVYVGIEFAVAPVSLEAVDFYLAQSPSATAANANPGGTDGADSAFTGTAGDSLDDSLRQLTYLGSLSVTADATTLVQYQRIGTAANIMRNCSIVVDNNTAQALVADAVEMFVAFIPLITESQ